MAARVESAINAEIEQIKSLAVAAGRELSDAEQERINDLIVERAATFRAHDTQWRAQYVRTQQAHWHAQDMAKLRTMRPSPVFLALIGVFATCSVLLYRTLPTSCYNP